MLEEQNRSQIIEKLTNEVLDEIGGSNSILTAEEITKIVEQKLGNIFKKTEESKNENEEEKNFTNFNEKDDLISSLGDFQVIGDNKSEKNEENLKNLNKEEPEEKKKFFQEVSNLYKIELQNSINCFKKAFESLKIIKKTSIIEKILILLFLVIPAILGGLLTLVFLLAIFILWQVAIVFKVLIKYLEKAEFSIKDTIIKIKKRITSLKNGGGFFNRLIFSNALYSLIMFNGILYVLIRGIVFPLKSIAEIDKIVANVTARLSQGLSNTLLAPSQLALNSLQADALRSGKERNRGTIKDKAKLQLKDFNRLKNLLKNKQNFVAQHKDNSKNMEKVKIISLKNEIAKTVLENIKNSPIFINNQVNKLEINNQQQTSSKKEHFENTRKQSNNDLGYNFEKILPGDNINNVKNFVENLLDKGLKDIIPNNKISSDFKEMHEDAQREIRENQKEVLDANKNLEKNGINTDGFNERYDIAKAESKSFSEFVSSDLSNWKDLSIDEQFRVAIDFADQRVAKEDVKDAQEFEKWANDNKDKTIEEYREYKLNDAEKDSKAEEREFQERYGLDCKQLMGEKIAEMGFDPKHQLTDSEFSVIAKAIASENSNGDSNKAVDMVKDLREYNISFKEAKLCKEELQQEKNNSREESRYFRDEVNSNRSGGKEIGIS